MDIFLQFYNEKHNHQNTKNLNQNPINQYSNSIVLPLIIKADAIGSLEGIKHELSKIKISNKDYFDVCYYGIPKMNTFIKYNAQKAKLDQEVKWIAEYYHVSVEQAKQYMKLLKEEEKEQIYDAYRHTGVKR